MDKLEMIQYLINDIDSEIKYLKEYKTKSDKLRDNKNWSELYNLRSPSKQRIKDNLKMIKRLTLDIERNDVIE